MFGNASLFRGGLDFSQIAVGAAVAVLVMSGALWRARKFPQVTVSCAVQEFCEADHTFGNASLFSGGLDFGQIAVVPHHHRADHGASYVVG